MKAILCQSESSLVMISAKDGLHFEWLFYEESSQVSSCEVRLTSF